MAVGHWRVLAVACAVAGTITTPRSGGCQAQPPEFNRDIRPILADKCFACHGGDAAHRQAGLRLDLVDGATQVLESGSRAIVPGSLEASEAWQRIQSQAPDECMPPPASHKQLTDAEKQKIARWIEGGAAYQRHWSFEPIRLPSPPAAEPMNSIDAWIVARLKREGFALSAPADRETLLRRVTFDLTGLPPTPEELDAFLADATPEAYEKQVERLLASSAYGERMATMWLDVARYGDTNGYLHDHLRTVWPWRDWVIQAFQHDMPFDQFVREQIAGDQIENSSPAQTLATAFCRHHLIMTEGGTLAAEFLNEYAADRVQTFGTAFLGLSLNCCRCHDHKFDPLTQEDFYSLQAYFNSIAEKHAENDPAPAYAPFIETVSPLLPEGAKVKVMVMKEALTPTKTFVLIRGQYDQPDVTHPVERRPPQALSVDAERAVTSRLDLAKWLVSDDNPLLARVTVNRLWQRVFGKGIVNTLDDFGVQGEYPSHPELLDYLAYAFQHSEQFGGAHQWSVKHVLRAIVTSATYKQASLVRSDVREKDPDNRWLAYFPRQRLTGEEIRDAALLVSGLLSPALGGPPVYPYQPEGLWEERANEASTTRVYVRSEGDALYRRSIYSGWKRTCPPPAMTVFDAPDRTYCTVRRSVTNTPLQALATLNDEQLLECAKMLAVRTLTEGPESLTADERLARMSRRVTGRALSTREVAALTETLDALRASYRERADDATALLRQGMASVPENLDAREVAAWMVAANALLNLDRALVRE
ncbi:MAG: PSD1 and planctomycete cytochrome C domain-containing protein [Planctomycetaceae bacterium]